MFQWHSKTTTTLDDYNLLASASPLLADVCCFPGPHINHLTPSTLDIDAAQQEMKAEGIPAKQIIEGPPRRPNVPILLRQTSFQAIQEPIVFVDHDHEVSGKHRARFGEIEERGAALTPKGKKLYERLLFQARQRDTQAMDNASYQQHLAHVFATFPDDLLDLIQQDLVYVAYEVAQEPASDEETQLGLVDLLASGRVRAKPLIYEDFLYAFPTQPISLAPGAHFEGDMCLNPLSADRLQPPAFSAATWAPTRTLWSWVTRTRRPSRRHCKARLWMKICFTTNSSATV